ncbi:DUF481 domain-containing protein [Myxococcaceae bacterium GXIMD 01537]
MLSYALSLALLGQVAPSLPSDRPVLLAQADVVVVPETPPAPPPSTKEAEEADVAARDRAKKATGGDVTAKVELPPEKWSGTAGIGLSWLSGNSNSFTLTGLVEAKRSWSKWALSARVDGAYGEARPAGEEELPYQVVAERLSAQIRGDRDLTEKLAVYVLLGGDTDHLKSIELRANTEAGLSYVWLEQREIDFTRLRLQTDLGFRYAREWRFQYYPTRMDLPDVNFVAPRAAAAFRYGFSKDVWFLEQLEVLPDFFSDPTRVLVKSTSRLSAGMTEWLALSATFIVDYDSQPPVSRKDTDTALVVSLDATF